MSKQAIPLADQSVLVTGAGGFIGSHLVKALQTQCKKVHALLGEGDPIPDWADNVESTTVDIRNQEQLQGHCQGIDTVIHLAGPPAVRESFVDPQRYADIHTGGTANMLHVAHESDVGRFVFISSAEVYGQPLTNPVDEQHRLLARSPYAAAKIGAERFVESFTQFSPMDAVVLRPFSIYGPGQTMNSLLGTILQQIEKGETIELADLRPARDYCFVGDLANAVLRACDATIERLAVLNIGSGRGTSVADFAAATVSAAGGDMEIRQANSSDRPASANITELVADCRLAQRVLGWQAETSLLDGLRQTVRFAGARS